MSDFGLSIAGSGVDAAQTAMDTIAQNLSNANTPGYVAETANLSSVPGYGIGVGDGVAVTSVTQANDGLLQANAQQTQAGLAQTSALQEVLQQAQVAFQEPSSTGLQSDLSTFWNSWDTLAGNPTNAGASQGVINAASNVVSDLQDASQQITTVAQGASSQLNSLATSDNTVLGQIANLNGVIQRQKGFGANPNSLIDQRNQLMNQLSSDLGATGTIQPNGTLQVNVGGVALVVGTWSDSLTTQTSGGTTQLVAAQSGAVLPTTSGTAAGLLASLNQYLPAYQSQLDTVANDLSSLVNGQLASGYTTSGTSGSPLFVGSGAGGIQVNPAVASNPSQLAISGTSTLPDASNDGSNAQAMANLGNVSNGPDQAYQRLVQQVGGDVSSATTQVQAQTAAANAAQQNLQSVVGVNQNDQLVSLMNFQQAYQASAKVISTLDNVVQSLLSAV